MRIISNLNCYFYLIFVLVCRDEFSFMYKFRNIMMITFFFFLSYYLVFSGASVYVTALVPPTPRASKLTNQKSENSIRQ